jgi:sulfhydrogenase subunit delta
VGKKQKLKLAVFGITGCKGCELSVAFNEDELLPLLEHYEIVGWPFISQKDTEKVLGGIEELDVVLMEGLVACKEDLEMLESVRKKTKVLVALGSCAHTGGIPAYKEAIPKDSYMHLMYDKVEKIKDLPPTPISDYVKVDFTVPGCPPYKEDVLRFLTDIALSKKPRYYKRPVCFECLQNGNKCLLLEGKFCMGPITLGGCNSVCTNSGFECWGCRGPTGDSNYRQFRKHLKSLGLKDDEIDKRLDSFNFHTMKRGEEDD